MHPESFRNTSGSLSSNMYLHKIPSFIQYFYPKYLWKMPEDNNVLYLTFDDGPTVEITEWVLEQLAAYRAEATFFMVGNNVKRHPEIAHKVIDAGHSLGNHTQNHLNGWKTETDNYLEDALLAQATFWEYTGYRPQLFRPPHGRLTSSQAQKLHSDLDIVMMDVISGDFDTKLSGEACARYVIDHANQGSIVVFHDSQKAWKRLSMALPMVLQHFSELGYSFKGLSPLRDFGPHLPEVLG